ncbi:Crp/Fnr family transcriptional regulator [Mobilitalea sibirica]|uniref:Crp/Fnr family transcriptional regulator n=1 Tax=Mobilitalea sibirica TaxID=1462919 RepID=A0A8J7HDJ9_9FIRM|nr:Crp/Fnr family transcriptional regulator [Mobilitalea sibirica]MBH1942157.1 Crp/Fnr family transcriptional regulator [Mobilitalea sibirica]
MEKHYPVLRKCVLFRNIEDMNYEHLLQCLGTQVRKYKEEEYVFFAGDVINHIGIVLSGVVEIMKENLAGNKHILAFIEPSGMFAEGIVCTAKRISPVTVQVKEDAEILFIPYERIIMSCGNVCGFHISLIQNMMIILGEKNFNLNRKLELLTLKGMREKIASFLINESLERKSNTFHIILNRTQMADYLNVSRTSMCRELARMKEEGLIDYYGHSFKILDMDELAQCLE